MTLWVPQQKTGQNTDYQAMFTLTDSAPTPSIEDTTAKAGDSTATKDKAASVTITKGDTLTITDEIKLKDLDTASEYTVQAELWTQGSVKKTETKKVEKGAATRTVTVTFTVTDAVDGQEYNIATKLYKGAEATGKAIAEHNQDKSNRLKNEQVKVTVNEPAPEPKITNTTAKLDGGTGAVTLADDADGMFTDEVSLSGLENGKTYTVVSTLYKDKAPFGEPVSQTVEGGATSLPVTFGTKVTEAGVYTVKTELQLDGETLFTHNGDLNDPAPSETITVTKEEPAPETTEVTVTKAWDDADDQDGKRPESIQAVLLADGTQVAETALNQANEWTHTWTDLAKNNEDGSEIVYTVDETDVPADYTKVVDGFTITNSYTPETIAIAGTKTWSDKDNQDGKRPSKITVNLLANGEKVDSKTVTEKDGWKYSFGERPKYKAGAEIAYTITEDAVADYTAKIDGYNVTNSYTPGKTSINVNKVWVDDNNKDNIRPESVTVQLYADGKAVDGKTITLNEGNKWAATFADLDAKKDGKDIKYTVDEPTVPAGYTKSVSGTTITNTHEPDNPTPSKPTKVTVSKTDLGGTELAGATIVVTGEGFEERWTSTEVAHELELAPGTYTMVEEAAPAGYEKVTTTITFTVDENGTVTGQNVTEESGSNVVFEGTHITLADAPTPSPTPDTPTTATVKISKQDLGGDEISGASMKLEGPEGFAIQEWTSDGTAKEFTLEAGEYTLTEVVAPAGYKTVTTAIKFTVAADGAVALSTATVDNGGRIELLEGNHIVLQDALRTPSLGTTVEFGGKQASADAYLKVANTDVSGSDTVTDHIAYADLVPGATYKVVGELVKVVNKEQAVVKTVEVDCVADASGSGTWDINFEGVELLEDTLYVVFETATLLDEGGQPALNEAGEIYEVLEHKNVDDFAQAISVGSGDENSGIDKYKPSNTGGGEEDNTGGDSNNSGNSSSDSSKSSSAKKSSTTTRTATTPARTATTSRSATTASKTSTTARTGDDLSASVLAIAVLAGASLAAGAFSLRRRRDQ